MPVTEKLICKITRLNTDGLGFNENKPQVIVPYSAPGDEIEAEKHQYKDNVNYVKTRIITPSNLRITPICKYFEQCGGCLLQHINHDTYKNYKVSVLERSLKKFNIKTRINDVIFIEVKSRRRLRCQFVKKIDENGQIKFLMGFNKFQSNKIVNIELCEIALPELSDFFVPLKNFLLQILAGNDRQRGEIFILKAHNGIDLIIDVKEQQGDLKAFEREISAFCHANGVINFTALRNKETLYQFKTQEPYIFFDDVKVVVSAGSFLQNTDASDKILIDLIKKYLAFDENDLCVDLFCGSGNYSLPISRLCQVDGFDVENGPLENIINAKVNSNINLFCRNLFENPLEDLELEKYTKAIINPPRSGAELQCKELAKSSIKKICYVSCNPETFSRDVRILERNGYKLIEITPLDQFQFSPHLEIIGLLEKLPEEDFEMQEN